MMTSSSHKSKSVTDEDWVIVPATEVKQLKEEEEPTKKEYTEKHQKRIKKCQRLHRTDITNWEKQNYFQIWKTKMKPMLLSEASLHPTPPIITKSSFSVQEFRAQFESQKIPCVVDHLADEWNATNKWSFQTLRELYGKVKMKCGEDDDGFPIKVKLETFVRYMENTKDDSPLYIFDTSYERTCPELVDDYCIPKIFPEDLFSLVGEKRRPPYRWFLIGPERSGKF
jgi:hypothetical protein